AEPTRGSSTVSPTAAATWSRWRSDSQPRRQPPDTKRGERPHERMSQQFGVSFGALAEPLARQIEDQGLAIDPTKCEHLQLDIHAANRLFVRGALSDSEYDKVRRRLMKKIIHAIEAHHAD